MLVNVTGLAADGQAADSLIRQLMMASAPEGYCLRENMLQFGNIGDLRVSGGTVVFTRSGSGEAAPCVDEGKLTRALRGQTLEAAGSYLVERFDLDAAPVISVVPAILGRMPLLSERITVTVDMGSE
jgi:hypothetical protein